MTKETSTSADRAPYDSSQSATLLIIGGTTEGRIALKVCDEAATPYYYSTKNVVPTAQSLHAILCSGGMDEGSMRSFCLDSGIQLIVDAAHPFALNVHRHVGLVAAALGLPVVRYERHFPERRPDLYHYVDSYAEAITTLEEQGYHRLLALTGVNSIEHLRPYWTQHPCYFRIMDRPESRATAERASFSPDQLIYYDDGEPDRDLYTRLQPQAILSKESGDTGGYVSKTREATALGIPVVVLRRPPLPYEPTRTVYGRHGLRRAIEELLPSFFALHTGYTTGTTATAATYAATYTLLTGKTLDHATITLPSAEDEIGEPATLPILRTTTHADGSITAVAQKRSGDDPDVTNGLEITATVARTEEHRGIRFRQGIGVGRVTLPGIGIEIGEPAINRTPRMMMTREVEALRTRYEQDEHEHCGIDITISVPEGEATAERTFNPKLGIVGGISIIGTSGIVKPFSSEAFVHSIRREIEVAKALGTHTLIINSGAKSERYLRQVFPDAAPQAFVQYGNFIGETISAAADLQIPHVVLSIMLGKAVKLAAGQLDTHSKKTVMDRRFLQRIALEAHCSPDTVAAIEHITLARELWSLIPHEEHAFFDVIAEHCLHTCAPLLPHGHLRVLLMDDDGQIRATAGAEQ